jgi:hypothetical protein
MYLTIEDYPLPTENSRFISTRAASFGGTNAENQILMENETQESVGCSKSWM